VGPTHLGCLQPVVHLHNASGGKRPRAHLVGPLLLYISSGGKPAHTLQCGVRGSW
jgi:hypothetical protein